MDLDFKTKIKLASFAIIVLGFMIGYKVIRPDRANRLTSLKRGITEMRQRSVLLDEVYNISAGLEKYQGSLFVSDAPSVLVNTINRFATDSGVRIRNLRPQKAVTKEFYGLMPLGLELEGSYHQIGQFLSLVENYTAMIRLLEIDIKRPQLYESSAPTPLLNAKLKLEGVFIIKD